MLLSNVQVLQQLVTSMCRTSSDVLLAVHERQPFPSSAVQRVMPSYRVRRASHYMMAMGLWRPPVETVIRTPMLRATLARRARTAVHECLVETRSELTLLSKKTDYEQLIDTFHVNCDAIVYMPGILVCFCSGGLNVGAGLLS